MLPHAYELPAAIVLVLGGALACFAGYRLFRIVLGIYGFILGAMLASSMMGVEQQPRHDRGRASSAAWSARSSSCWRTSSGSRSSAPGSARSSATSTWTLVRSRRSARRSSSSSSALAGAVGAMMLQRYVIIVGTAFGGAWTMIVGAVNAAGDRGHHARRLGDRGLDSVSHVGAGRALGAVRVSCCSGSSGIAVQLGDHGRRSERDRNRISNLQSAICNSDWRSEWRHSSGTWTWTGRVR